ncbi:helicase SEN1-like [Iris pallida]|uniref:Helicase SEN1-like n=1 Tax=Iris pallida TaxID=29817 RepID=A0AAX6HGR4_IRIPA|nr:helicase SEN1-like [Iris pallida]
MGRKEREGREKEKEGGEKKPKGDLARLIFSWSLADICNKDLFKHNVAKIPNTFKSLEGYLMSFVFPFLEELRADLSSCFEALSQAPFVNILTLQRTNSKKTSSYCILVGSATNASHGGGNRICKPKRGDVFVLSNVKPTDVSDLNQYDNPYNVALVTKGGDYDVQLPPNTYIIISSNAIDDTRYKEKEKKTDFLFAVYLFNITTYRRIWNALNVKPMKDGEITLIEETLYTDPLVLSSKDVTDLPPISSMDSLLQFGLNESQNNAVLSCISARHCYNKNSVKLIWGPPGIGKTKTVCALLWMLHKGKCRTLTCAPTNTAVVQVVSRLLVLVKEHPAHDALYLWGISYYLGIRIG